MIHEIDIVWYILSENDCDINKLHKQELIHQNDVILMNLIFIKDRILNYIVHVIENVVMFHGGKYEYIKYSN